MFKARGQSWERARSVSMLCVLLLVSLATTACSESSDTDGNDPKRDAGGSDTQDSSMDTPKRDRDRIYVTIAGNDEVIAIDDDTREVSSHIPVGKGPAIILATPDYSQLYTANWSDNTVSAIELATKKVTSIKTKGRPYVIAMAPSGDYVYAGLNSNQIAVIDTKSNKIEKMFPTEALPASIIVSADGETLYVATLAGNLSALHTADGSTARDNIKVGATPAWITISPDGQTVYTLNFLSDDVSVVDTTSWTVEATVSTGQGSLAIIGNVTPDNSRLYVTNYGTGELMGIDADTHEVVQTVQLDGRPVGVNFDPEGERVFVADFGPKSLAQAANTTFLLTGSFGATEPGQISVFDTGTGKLVGEKISVGPGPTSIVYVPR